MPATVDSRAAPVLALVFNAFVWGISWWPFRELQSQGLHPLWATAGIYLVSLAALLAWRPGALRGIASHRELWLLMLAAGLTNVGFNWAVATGDVVRVVLLFYLMPAWSIVLAWPLLGERPALPALARVAMALAGVFVILKSPASAWPVPETLADGLAILGGLSFALTNILLRRLHATPAPTRVGAMFTGGALAAGLAGFGGMAQGLVTAPGALPASALLLGLVLSLGFLAGNAALQYGAARLPAQVTALVMLAEVLFASLSSVLAGAAELDARTWAGGALVVLAALWSAWAVPRTERRPAAQSAA